MVLLYNLCLQVSSNGTKVNYEVSKRHVVTVTQKNIHLHESDKIQIFSQRKYNTVH